MFLVFFLLFVFLFTVFENILIASVFLLLVSLSMFVYQRISKKKVLSKMSIISLLGAFLLAGIVFGIKEWRYYSADEIINIFKSSPLNGSPSFQIQEKLNKKQEKIMWTGSISDISAQGKYVFGYDKSEYLLYSKKQYAIGDLVWLMGNLQKNIHPEWFSYRNISSSTFEVSLFTWGFDYPKWLKMKGRKGTIYETSSMLLSVMGDEVSQDFKSSTASGPPPLSRRKNGGEGVWIIKKMKKSIQEKTIETYGKNKISWLVLGMLIGDKSQIPESEYKNFVDSGLVHLIAVSGWNILMIVVFLQLVLFWLPFYVRIAVILCTIVVYGFVCGLDSSVFRAVIMWGMSMLALFWGREINIRRLLSMSAILMLIINPYFLVYDVGFLLSYSALIGLIYFQTLQEGEKCVPESVCQANPPQPSLGKEGMLFSWEGGERKKGWIQKILKYIYKNYISPSIGASIGIFPVIIFFMGKMNFMGIIGNLFVLPIVPFVMIYGFVSSYLYAWIGREWILWVEKIAVVYIYKVAELLTKYGIFVSVSWLWIKYFFLLWFLVLFVVWRYYWRDLDIDKEKTKESD